MMKIEKNKVVSLSYELTVDGVIADKAGEEAPLEYIHGTHVLLPAFEAAIDGLSEGENYSFTLTPEEGYGSYDPSKLVCVPKENFSIDGVVREDLLSAGRIIPMLDASGQVVQGIVKEVGADRVIMDFNHLMAGKTLNFKGKILAIREASQKELDEGLHGEYLPPEEHCCHHGGGHGCCHGKGHGEGCHGEGHGGGCCHGDGHNPKQ